MPLRSQLKQHMKMSNDLQSNGNVNIPAKLNACAEVKIILL